MVDNRYSPYKGLRDRRVESLMPKGVEHIIDRSYLTAPYNVESLMPKGFEHANRLDRYRAALIVLNL